MRLYRASKPYTPSEYKEFRANLARLKREGKIDVKVDARSASPVQRIKGKRLDERVRDALKKEQSGAASKSVPKKSPTKLAPLNKAISIKDLPGAKKTLGRTLDGLLEHADEINRLKRPDDFFAFSIHGTDSLRPFREIETLAEILKESAELQRWFNKRAGNDQGLFDSIKIVRFNRSATEWRAQRKVRGRAKSHADRQARSRARKRK